MTHAAPQTLKFPSEEALRVALTSALVPEDVAVTAARGWRDRDGALYVAPDKAIAGKSLKQLEAAGVSLSETAPTKTARHATCWAELVESRPAPVDEIADGQVMFVVPSASAMLELAGELVRLGCDRVELRNLGEAGGCLVRAHAPPYYTLSRALDRDSGMRAFGAVPGSGDRVWIEAGWTHPLAGLLRPEIGKALLLSPDRPWSALEEGAWTDIYSIVDLTAPAEDVTHEAVSSAKAPRLAVALRLTRGAHSDVPELWMIRDDAIPRVERWLSSVPDEILSGLLFAVTADDPPAVVLRTRSGGRAPVTIEIEGDAFRVHPSIANLFLPVGATLEPPLRRDRLRDLLASDPDEISWVSRSPSRENEVRVEKMREDAFRSLVDWVSYIVDASAPKLAPWVRGATFEFSSFEVQDLVPAEREEKHHEDKEKKKKEPVEKVKAEPHATTRTRTKTVARDDAPAVVLVVEEKEQPPIAAELSAKEAEFTALTSAADAPDRLALYRDMGSLNFRLGRAKDAALCWSRAVWDSPHDEALEIAHEWSRAESHNGKSTIASAIAAPTPSRDDVRMVASLLASAALEDTPPKIDLQAASVWIDRNEASLDLRAFWLARASISRLVGGDALGLARARDLVLSKLHSGLSVERDVPTFLRFVGDGGDRVQVERLFERVEEVLVRFEKTKRARSSVEANPKLTLAYVQFVIAYGAARLGQTDRARSLAEKAKAGVPASDAIHDFLCRAYAARIEHAIEGLPPESPLPSDVSARLNALDKLSRYKVDRLRQFSTVLEPHERLDPVVAFQRGEADPRGPEFAALRGMSDVMHIEQEVEKILDKAQKATPDERARLFDGVMDFFPVIHVDRARRHLRSLVSLLGDIPPPRRAQLLEEALMLAGHVGDEELGRRIFRILDPLIAGLGAESVHEIAPVMGGMLRTLRRVGLRDEASQLLQTMQKAATGSGVPAMVARLHTSAALAYLGHFDTARPVFEETLTFLAGDVPVPARLELTRALARAVGNAPIDYALAVLQRLGGQISIMTDSFNTNSHVCISVVAFVEALVLGYASENLVIGEKARQWLDDDEYLIRRRVHRDMEGTR